MHPEILIRGAQKKGRFKMTVDNSKLNAVKPEDGLVNPLSKELNMENSIDDVVDLEEFAATGKPVPANKRYRLRIDKAKVVVDVPEMNGRQILAQVGMTPEKHVLRQKIRGEVHPVGPDQIVSFLAPGVERFMTIPNEVTEGEGLQSRRQVSLLTQDVLYLDSLGLRWETIIEQKVKAVIIYGWTIPPGYNVPIADVHVRFSEGYPDAQLDMAYFSPDLMRADLRSINNLSGLEFDGRGWQQWSRHRTTASAWRPGEDDLSTHMALATDWLVTELRK